MTALTFIPLVVVAVGLIAVAAARTKVPYSVLLAGCGLAAGLVPGLPRFVLDPQVVFAVLLPPGLVALGVFTSTTLLRATLPTGLLLGVGLLAASAVAGAAAAHVAVGLPWASALVLGLLAAAPDTGGFKAAAGVVGAPRRLGDALAGEGLIALVVALLAADLATGAAASGAFSIAEAAARIVLTAGGGLLLGAALGLAHLRLLGGLDDPTAEIALSLALPFAVSLLAAALGVSVVVAGVTAGLLTGRLAVGRASAATRQQSGAFWGLLLSLVSGATTFLIALAVPNAVGGLAAGSPLALAGFAAGLLCLLLGLRFLFALAATFLPPLKRRGGQPPRRPAEAAALAWAGGRGLIVAAATLALPPALPGRDAIVVVMFLLTLSSQFVQGLTLAPLLRRLGFSGHGEAAEERAARMAAAKAGLRRLAAPIPGDREDAVLVRQLRAHYERVIAGGAVDGFARLRAATLDAEREALRSLRERDALGDDALGRLERELDLETLRLARADAPP